MTIADLIRYAGFFVLYIVTGFGPGLAIGVILANAIGGRNYEHHSEKFLRSAKEAREHNAQWHPDHERWQR